MFSWWNHNWGILLIFYNLGSERFSFYLFDFIHRYTCFCLHFCLDCWEFYQAETQIFIWIVLYHTAGCFQDVLLLSIMGEGDFSWLFTSFQSFMVTVEVFKPRGISYLFNFAILLSVDALLLLFMQEFLRFVMQLSLAFIYFCLHVLPLCC